MIDGKKRVERKEKRSFILFRGSIIRVNGYLESLVFYMRVKNDKVIDVGIIGFYRFKWNYSVIWCYCYWMSKFRVLLEVSNV